MDYAHAQFHSRPPHAAHHNQHVHATAGGYSPQHNTGNGPNGGSISSPQVQHAGLQQAGHQSPIMANQSHQAHHQQAHPSSYQQQQHFQFIPPSNNQPQQFYMQSHPDAQLQKGPQASPRTNPSNPVKVKTERQVQQQQQLKMRMQAMQQELL